MEKVIEVIWKVVQENTDFLLMAIILLIGIFISKYLKSITFIHNRYKILIGATLISIIFFFIDGSNISNLKKYIFTYFITTSFYELILKFIKEKMKSSKLYNTLKQKLSKNTDKEIETASNSLTQRRGIGGGGIKRPKNK